MKYIFFFILITLIACSTTKHLNNKWIGKTDQDVVNEFGMPDSVASYGEKGKLYLYNSVERSNLYKYKHPVNNRNLDNTYPVKNSFYVEKNIFFIDSLNKIYKVISLDSNYTKGNFFYIKH